MSDRRCIAIAAEGDDWHTRRLRKALHARSFTCRLFSLADCYARVCGSGQRQVCLPPGRRPAGVLVRSMPPGSFQQIILRLDLLRQLEAEGVVVCNGAGSLELAVDKAESSLYMARAGLPTPPAWVCQSAGQARTVLRTEIAAGHRVLIKPMFGAQGRGLRLMRRADAPLPAWTRTEGVYYLQRFIAPAQAGVFRDFRVFVVGGRAVAAMCRQHAHWITNRACGGLCRPWPLQRPLASLAEAATRVLRLDYAGVDLISSARRGLMILEVNSVPSWRGLQSVCSVDLADRAVAHLCRRVHRASRRVKHG